MHPYNTPKGSNGVRGVGEGRDLIEIGGEEEVEVGLDGAGEGPAYEVSSGEGRRDELKLVTGSDELGEEAAGVEEEGSWGVRVREGSGLSDLELT